LNISLGKVGYTIQIANLLNSGDAEITNAPNYSEALRILLKRKENELQAELAKRNMPPVKPKPVAPELPTNVAHLPHAEITRVALEHQEKVEKYNVAVAEQELEAVVTSGVIVPLDEGLIVPLSSMLFTQPDMNTLSRIHDMGPGICDHIITDPPYGIEMGMLQQDGGGMKVEEVAETHDVEDNMFMLINSFLPTAFRALKENGYLVFWCDVMNWHALYNAATLIGFKVQRWPIVWDKLHRCQNMAAQYNFTKTTEIAMVCRKGNATLIQPSARSVISCSNDDVKKRYGHAFAKPPQLTEFIARHISMQGQTILEPFAGRGSIVLPLLEAGRKVIAVEYEKSVHFPYLVENVRQHYLKINKDAKFV
jgi:site-specific DNA-methyltransferase (adenine-specific)